MTGPRPASSTSTSRASSSCRSCPRFLFRFVDRPIDAFYEKIVVAVGRACTGVLKAAHNGLYANYLAWTIGGLVIIVWAIGALMR